MKTLRLLALSLLAAVCARAQPSPVLIQPATQAQVNAGTSQNTYVSPFTLNGWTGGGGGGYNPAQVAITGGTIGGTIAITAAGANLTATNFFGAVNYIGNGPGQGTFNVFAPATESGLAIDPTQSWGVLTLTGADAGHPNEVLTIATPGLSVQHFCVIIYNADSVVHTPTFVTAGSQPIWSYSRGSVLSTGITIQPATYTFLTFDYDGTNFYMKGDSVYTNNLQSKTPVTTDEVVIGDSATNYTAKEVPLSALPTVHSVTLWANGNGSLLTTGTQTNYQKVNYAGTVTGWTLICSPSGSVTVDVFRSTNASDALPTVSMIGAGTKPIISTDVQNSRTTAPNDWTSNTIAVGDNLVLSVTSATTATYVNLVLYYQ